MKAVVTTGGKQYLVAKGDQLEIELIKDVKDTLTFEPLAIFDGATNHIGTPVVAKAKVTAKVVDPLRKQAKVTSIRYKAKKRVHKQMGHRQPMTVIEITDIVV